MKRQAENLSLDFSVDCVLLDIEGTTTSIKFVKNELFPFACSNVQKHLEETWHTDETQNDVTTLLDQIAKDAEEATQDSPVEDDHENVEEETKTEIIKKVSSAVQEMIARDRKIGPLKTLQGHVWRKGYKDGLIKGHVYEDVVPKLRSWKEEDNLQLYIYSSGSVEAQKLLFGHTKHGDLTQLFSGHFDTLVGLKTSTESYVKIASSINTAVDRILFLTDVAAEARAATSAGMQVAVADRPGNSLDLQEGEQYPVFKTFDDIHITNEKKTKS